jgi:hypothetical protein
VKGFDEVVVSAELHSLNGAIDHVIGAHDQHHAEGTFRFNAARHFDPVDAGQNDIEYRKAWLFRLEDRQCIFAGACGEDFEAFVASLILDN